MKKYFIVIDSIFTISISSSKNIISPFSYPVEKEAWIGKATFSYICKYGVGIPMTHAFIVSLDYSEHDIDCE